MTNANALSRGKPGIFIERREGSETKEEGAELQRTLNFLCQVPGTYLPCPLEIFWHVTNKLLSHFLSFYLVCHCPNQTLSSPYAENKVTIEMTIQAYRIFQSIFHRVYF